MNFLGHAYIARNNPQLIAGNFAGDSYKGSLQKFEHLPKQILDGVKLHRYIDNYTDSSPHILAAGQILKDQGIKKIAFIATDIILDHYLAKNWNTYSNVGYEEFIDIIYANTDPHLDYLTEEFKFLYYRLKKYDWLNDYSSEAGIRGILHQFSVRIGFANDLDDCMNIYLKNAAVFDDHFARFLKDIESDSSNFIAAL